MKKTGFLCILFLVILLNFISCSKEEVTSQVGNDTAYLSFQTHLNNIARGESMRQLQYDLPNCIDGIPVYIEIILSTGDVYVAGNETTPHRLKINSNARTNGDGLSNYFTAESATLELLPGTYMLEYFTVLDEYENILWIAPVNNHTPGGIDDMVEHSLPLEIVLGAGVKKYQNVEVVCFDDKLVNEYGYLFFDLNGTQIIQFCIFGNYCDETGRHAEFILYEVDVWKYSGNPWAPKGEILHENVLNHVDVADYEDSAEVFSYPLCVTLPDGPGLDEYYIEITRVYSGTDDGLIRSGLISDLDVRDLFRDNGTMDFFHFREGNCNLEDEPLLLGDHRDILGSTWQFTFYFGEDSAISVDVDFYEDGTASYRLYGDPNNPIIGTWSYLDDHLYYDPDGEENILGITVSGKYVNGHFSGTYWRSGAPDNWTAFRKD